MPLDKDVLLRLVATGNTREAINVILSLKEEINQVHYYTILGLSAELAENEKAALTHTLSQEVLSIQKNSINQSLIELIPKLDKVPATYTPIETQNREGTSAPLKEDSLPQPFSLKSTQLQVEKWVETLVLAIAQMVKRPWKYKLINLLAFFLFNRAQRVEFFRTGF